MTALTLVPLLLSFLQSVPTILPLVQKLTSDIAAGKGNATVTAEDLAELTRLASLTGEGIYRASGVTPPPA